MATTRRDVLVQGAVIGAGLLSPHLSGAAALAQAKAPPVRRSLQGLAWNDPIVATYRDAVGQMKNLDPSKPFNWVSLSGIHGTQNAYHFCPHGDWYFLPWHRAYTVMYERIVRSLTKNNDFAMPFWDWTSNPQMPEVFLDATTPDGKTNWLCIQDKDFQRTWPKTKPMPINIVGPAVLKQILSATPYEVFGTSRNPGQKDLNPKWVPAGGGTQGILEGLPHNQVHNNIGGWMPTGASPRDPIFFMHHTNIDRIWAVWSLQHGNSTDPLWLNMPFKDNFWTPPGQKSSDPAHWSPFVHELLDPEKLGYSYGLKKPAAAGAPIALELGRRLSTALASPGLQAATHAGTVTASVDNSTAATAGAPLAITVPLPEAPLRAVARRAPVASGLDTMNFEAFNAANASGTRAYAVLRDVAVTDPQTTLFLVFLNSPDLKPDTPTTDPHYVGAFGVFEHGDRMAMTASEHAPSSFLIDLTDAIGRVYGSDASAPTSIVLQLQPTSGEPGSSKPIGTATPKRVEVLLVSA